MNWFDVTNPNDFDFLCLTERQLFILILVDTTENTPTAWLWKKRDTRNLKVLEEKNLITQNGNYFDLSVGVMLAYIKWLDRGLKNKKCAKHFSALGGELKQEPSDIHFAKSGELAKEFGATDEEAKIFETRLEFLSGNTPHIVYPSEKWLRKQAKKAYKGI